MLPIKGPQADMGVIIARFQTPYLTEGHRKLIETVRHCHNKFAIFIGISPVIPSRKNPLDFATRAQMILDAYPGTEIHPIRDNRSDDLWSKTVDSTLRLVHPHEKIVLYGSRDSFLAHYTGKMLTAELDEIHGIAATDARQQAFHDVRATEDFRRGVCYATANQYAKKALCVDVAVVDIGKDFRVLLGKRNEDTGWRFFGGHIVNETAAAAGRREVLEEGSCTIREMEYIGDTPIADWRYEGTGDYVHTIFFAGHFWRGQVQAGDDIDQVQWFPITLLEEKMFVPEHHVLLDMLLRHYGLRGIEEIKTSVADDEYIVRNLQFNHIDGQKMVVSPVEREKVNL